jgi:predicted metal-dependent hydrolase
MTKEITIENHKVSYTLRKSKRARGLRLTVYGDGTIVVTTPVSFQESAVERFIKERSKWLFSKIDFFKKFKSPLQGSVLGGGARRRSSRRDYLKYKDAAYELAVARAAYFNDKTYGLSFNRISIKNQKSRWGSCSKKGNLNFNYRIALLPPELADYIIVHELCHLKEFNHSPKFWKLVEMEVSNYRALRNQLKSYL